MLFRSSASWIGYAVRRSPCARFPRPPLLRAEMSLPQHPTSRRVRDVSWAESRNPAEHGYGEDSGLLPRYYDLSGGRVCVIGRGRSKEARSATMPMPLVGLEKTLATLPVVTRRGGETVLSAGLKTDLLLILKKAPSQSSKSPSRLPEWTSPAQFSVNFPPY